MFLSSDLLIHFTCHHPVREIVLFSFYEWRKESQGSGMAHPQALHQDVAKPRLEPSVYSLLVTTSPSSREQKVCE